MYIYCVGSAKLPAKIFGYMQPIFYRYNLFAQHYKCPDLFIDAATCGYIDTKSTCIVVVIYSEDHKNSFAHGKKITEFCGREFSSCKILHSAQLGAILNNKIQTNKVLAAAGVTCPAIVTQPIVTRPIFCNATHSTQWKNANVQTGGSLNPKLYNTEFINTVYNFKNKQYYATVRTMCVGPQITAIYIRLRATCEGCASVHSRNTPQNSELINSYYADVVEPQLETLTNICNIIGNTLGLGFYAHDFVYCVDTLKFYCVESGFKVVDSCIIRHLNKVSPNLISFKDYSTRLFAEKQAKTFISQLSGV